MGNNSVPKFIFCLSRFPVYRRSVSGRFYCTFILLHLYIPEDRDFSTHIKLIRNRIFNARLQISKNFSNVFSSKMAAIPAHCNYYTQATNNQFLFISKSSQICSCMSMCIFIAELNIVTETAFWKFSMTVLTN